MNKLNKKILILRNIEIIKFKVLIKFKINFLNNK